MPDTQTSLGEWMDRRRVELRLTWREVAERADLSIAGLNAIRNGTRNPTDLTRRGIEEALGWGGGSVTAVLAGGKPTTATRLYEHEFHGDVAAPADEVEKIRQLLEEALRRLAVLQDRVVPQGSYAHRTPLQPAEDSDVFTVYVPSQSPALQAAEREVYLADEALKDAERAVAEGRMDDSPGTRELRARLQHELDEAREHRDRVAAAAPEQSA